ncbi:MAG: thiamine-phosphate kinase [Candidatus Sumerlaeia bacterium]|nr:thiamine-phosphate kinase [Candidatus Sumerlaeia bacterium]
MSAPDTLASLGERGLLERLRPLLSRHSEGLVLGTGDDAAVLPAPPPGTRQVWTLDTMVEGVHFRWWKRNSPRLVGRKLAASNLSDLAAMGAEPESALLSFAAPGDAAARDAVEFFEGLAAELQAHGARLIGGDVVHAPQWCLTLSLSGRVRESAPVAARGAARPGDFVYLTGSPGESAAGLELLEGHAPAARGDHSALVARHLAPTPRLAEGRLLASLAPRLAMIDVSDGVAHECWEVARQSAAAVVLFEDALTPSPGLGAFARETGQDALDLLLYGGEDYELVACLPTDEARVAEAFAAAGLAPPRRVGRVEAGAGVFLERSGGRREPLGPGGFEHFRDPGAAH